VVGAATWGLVHRFAATVGTMASMSHLTTVRIAGATRAGRVDGDEIVLLNAPDVGAVLRTGEATESGERVAFDEADLAPLVTHPGKIICVGVNYLDHIAEMGRERPDFPTYFGKYREALVGARDDLILPDPSVSTQIDWEAELAIVIGKTVRNVSTSTAIDAVAGYTVINDGTVRDWQRRTTQFLAGKTFEGLSPLGPVLVGTDELGDGSGLEIRCEVNGVTKQLSSTSELCFTVADIVADLSTILTLEPGDVIATGTPSGVGAARNPPEWLADGSVLRCSIEGIGATENRCRLP
jgi:acylpyruvate hydrolase